MKEAAVICRPTPARVYIESVRWQYATTMPQWPHEYTIKDWRPELSRQLEAFCRLLRSEGVLRPWPEESPHPRYRNYYLVIDDHKYWALGPNGDQDPTEGMTVINREAFPDPSVIPREVAANHPAGMAPGTAHRVAAGETGQCS